MPVETWGLRIWDDKDSVEVDSWSVKLSGRPSRESYDLRRFFLLRLFHYLFTRTFTVKSIPHPPFVKTPPL